VACLLVSCTLISIHFMLLDHWTAACLGILAATRFAASLFSTSKKLMGFFVLTTIVVAAASYEGILSILAGTGGVFGTVASFCKEDKQLRQLMLIGTSLWLIHNILAGSPGARLTLAGSQPTPAIEKLAIPGGAVSVTGEVPDINEHLAASGIFVAPVRLGLGVKGKVLEAFSAGVPVVATSAVARGIPEAKGRTHLLVADSPRSFAGAVARLRADFQLYSGLAHAARNLAEKHYSWPDLAGDLARAYDNAVTGAKTA